LFELPVRAEEDLGAGVNAGVGQAIGLHNSRAAAD
jgi:hypothetical protein